MKTSIRQRLRRYGIVLAVATALTVFVLATQRADSATAPPWCTDRSDVAILGTSADTGYATTGYSSPTDTFARTRFGWATMFADDLSATWATTTHNYAHNGALASDFLPGGRWPSTVGAVADMRSAAPSIVIIDLGGNELWSQVDPAVFKANLGAIVDNIRAQRPDTVILFSIYAELRWQPNEFGSVQKYTWSQYAQAIYDTAVAKGTALMDLRQAVPPAGSTPMISPNPWTSDGIHLNEAGNMAEFGNAFRWVSAIWSVCG